MQFIKYKTSSIDHAKMDVLAAANVDDIVSIVPRWFKPMAAGFALATVQEIEHGPKAIQFFVVTLTNGTTFQTTECTELGRKLIQELYEGAA